MLIPRRKILFSCQFKLVNDKNVYFVQALKSKTRKEFVNVFATVELKEKWAK